MVDQYGPPPPRFPYRAVRCAPLDALRYGGGDRAYMPACVRPAGAGAVYHGGAGSALALCRAGDEGGLALTQAGEASRRWPEAVAVWGALVQQLVTTPAATWEMSHRLPRVLAEQGTVNIEASGTPTIQSQVAAEMPCESLYHPADLDSSSKAHRGQGYAAQIMETYATEAQAAGATPTALSHSDLMLPVAVPKMTHPDSPARAPALAEGRSSQWGPARWLGDSHNGSPESVAQCQSERMALGAPARPPKGAKQGQLRRSM
jgi:hypothetical protein